MVIAPQSMLLAQLGAGGLRWYDWVFLVFAVAIVWPDSVVEWMSNRAGRVLGTGWIWAIELIALAGLTVFSQSLISANPRVHWWHPILCIGVAAFIRLFVWVVDVFFGLRH